MNPAQSQPITYPIPADLLGWMNDIHRRIVAAEKHPHFDLLEFESVSHALYEARHFLTLALRAYPA